MNRVQGGKTEQVAQHAPADTLFPDPVRILNPSGEGPFVLACEHASNLVPPSLRGLGLDPADLADHIAWDIGAAALTEKLSAKLDAPAVLAGYSRLLYDCNRAPDAPDCIPARADGRIVTGNERLDATRRRQRREGLYEPFHAALDEILGRRGPGTALITIHSFTPRMRSGPRRDLHAGIIFDGENPFARRLAQQIAAHEGIICRINEPYAASDGVTHTLRRHGAGRGLRHAMIEIRNDLLRSETNLSHWADILHRSVQKSVQETTPETG